MEDSHCHDYGRNLPRERGDGALTPQASKLLHDLLHGKHNEVLHDATGRYPEAISSVCITKDTNEGNEAGVGYGGLEFDIVFSTTLGGRICRAHAFAYFNIKIISDRYSVDPCEAEADLGELCEEDQLAHFKIEAVAPRGDR